MTAGLTETEPLTGRVPATPLMVTVVAFAVVHANVDDCPALIVDGVAVNDTTVGAARGVTTTVVVPVAVPPGPVAVRV